MIRSVLLSAFFGTLALATHGELLYWFVDESQNEVGNFDYAKVRTEDGTYLPVVDSAGSRLDGEGFPYGYEVASDDGGASLSGDGSWVDLDEYGYAGSAHSFMIELYSDSKGLIGQSELREHAKLSAYIKTTTTSAVGTPWTPTIEAVPEPSSGLLLLFGLTLVALRRGGREDMMSHEGVIKG